MIHHTRCVAGRQSAVTRTLQRQQRKGERSSREEGETRERSKQPACCVCMCVPKHVERLLAKVYSGQRVIGSAERVHGMPVTKSLSEYSRLSREARKRERRQQPHANTGHRVWVFRWKEQSTSFPRLPGGKGKEGSQSRRLRAHEASAVVFGSRVGFSSVSRQSASESGTTR